MSIPWRVGLALLLVVAASAGGAEGLYKPIENVGLRLLEGDLFLRGEVHTDDQSTGSIRTKEDTALFEEGVDVRTEGYVYHPNFLDWSLNLRLGASQERVATDRGDFRTNGTLLSWDFSGLWLQEKPLSVRTFASQNESLRDRDFRRSTRVREDRLGVELRARGRFPGRLRVEGIRIRDDGDLRLQTECSKHLEFNVADRRDPNWLTELLYDRWDTDETATFLQAGGVTQDLSERIDEATLTNLWRFEQNGRRWGALTGRVRLLDRRGFFNNRIASFTQRLDLDHTETFSTFYEGRYIRDETDTEDDRTATGRFGFDKSIYESLDITGTFDFTQRDFVDGRDRSYSGLISTRYRKTTPLGRYTSGLLLGRQCQEQQSENRQRFFRDDATRLTGLDYVELAQRNIDVDTIVVTDAANAVTYEEGRDYVIRQTGALTEIARLGGGFIADGEVVLVDYTARVGLDAKYTVRRFNWSHRLDLAKLPVALYTDFRLHDERLRAGDDPGNLDRERIFLVGAELDHKGLFVMGEYEKRRQDLSPAYDTARTRVDYSRRLGQNVDMTAGGSADFLRYNEGDIRTTGFEGDRLDTIAAYARVNARVRPDALVTFQSHYTDTSGREDSSLFRNSVSLEWHYGKLDLTVDIHYDVYEQRNTDGKSFGMMFYLKRGF